VPVAPVYTAALAHLTISAQGWKSPQAASCTSKPAAPSHIHPVWLCRKTHSVVWAASPGICHLRASSNCWSAAAVRLQHKASPSGSNNTWSGHCTCSTGSNHVGVWAEERFCLCPVGRGWDCKPPLPQACRHFCMQSLQSLQSLRWSQHRSTSAKSILSGFSHSNPAAIMLHPSLKSGFGFGPWRAMQALCVSGRCLRFCACPE